MADGSISGALAPYPQSATGTEHSHLNPSNPPGPGPLSRSPKTVMKNPLASPVVKNIAGFLIAAGTGAAVGCPVVVGALISVGLATSWVGGAGLIIACVGVGLWLVSTYLSNVDRPAGQTAPGHFVESIFMGAVGIVYAAVDAIGNNFNSCCCGVDPDDDDDIFFPQCVSSVHSDATSSHYVSASTSFADILSLLMSENHQVVISEAADEPVGEEIDPSESHVGNGGSQQQRDATMTKPAQQGSSMPTHGGPGGRPTLPGSCAVPEFDFSHQSEVASWRQ